MCYLSPGGGSISIAHVPTDLAPMSLTIFRRRICPQSVTFDRETPRNPPPHPATEAQGGTPEDSACRGFGAAGRRAAWRRLAQGPCFWSCSSRTKCPAVRVLGVASRQSSLTQPSEGGLLPAFLDLCLEGWSRYLGTDPAGKSGSWWSAQVEASVRSVHEGASQGSHQPQALAAPSVIGEAAAGPDSSGAETGPRRETLPVASEQIEASL